MYCLRLENILLFCPLKISKLDQRSLKLTFSRNTRNDMVLITVSRLTPFENAQRWMDQNTFPILPLNDDNIIGEH